MSYTRKDLRRRIGGVEFCNDMTVSTASGAGTLYYSGSCPQLIITNGITPSFSASALFITED